MNWVIDVLLVLAFIAVVFFFAYFGLAKALSKISSVWLSLIVALVIGPIFTGWFETLFLNGAIKEGVHSALIMYVEGNANGYNLAEMFENIPQGLQEFLHALGADLTTLEAEFGSYSQASEEIVLAMSERIAMPIISIISGLIGMILGLIIPWLVMFILGRWVERSDKSKFIGFIDHVGGLALGVAVGYLAVFLIALLIRTCFRLVVVFDAGIDIMSIYYSSHVFQYLCELDILGFLFG